MAKHNIKGKIVFECDGCQEVLDTEAASWDEANEKRKEEGWRVEQVVTDHKTEWLHWCKDCK